MERPLILLVEDNIDLVQQLGPVLQRAGFDIEVVMDGAAALQYLDAPPAGSRPDLIVLDVILPKINGREINGRDVLRHIRGAGDDTPVIIYSAVGDEGEVVETLGEGADNYVRKPPAYLGKPFAPRELIALMKAMLRRVQLSEQTLPASDCLASGDLKLNTRSERFWLRDQELSLPPMVAKLLIYLINHPDELFSRAQLLDQVWGYTTGVSDRTVDSHIHRLRQALQDAADDPHYIEALPGRGYRFKGIVERVPCNESGVQG